LGDEVTSQTVRHKLYYRVLLTKQLKACCEACRDGRYQCKGL